MQVQSLYSKPIEPSRSVHPTERKAYQAPEATDQSLLEDAGDRVVISNKARAVLNEMRRLPDVDLGLQALLSAVPLTEERAEQVLSRINQGFYKQPDVLREMATLLSEVLGSDIP
jgi:hypothetical protein